MATNCRYGNHKLRTPVKPANNTFFALTVYGYAFSASQRSYEQAIDPSSSGDTKAGTLIGTDKFGNKFYENLEEELPCKHSFLV